MMTMLKTMVMTMIAMLITMIAMLMTMIALFMTMIATVMAMMTMVVTMIAMLMTMMTIMMMMVAIVMMMIICADYAHEANYCGRKARSNVCAHHHRNPLKKRRNRQVVHNIIIIRNYGRYQDSLKDTCSTVIVSEATMATTREVVAEEDCSRDVAKIPMASLDVDVDSDDDDGDDGGHEGDVDDGSDDVEVVAEEDCSRDVAKMPMDSLDIAMVVEMILMDIKKKLELLSNQQRRNSLCTSLSRILVYRNHFLDHPLCDAVII